MAIPVHFSFCLIEEVKPLPIFPLWFCESLAGEKMLHAFKCRIKLLQRISMIPLRVRFGLSLLKTNRLLRNLNLHRTSRMMSVQTKRALCRFPPADLNTNKHKNKRGNDPTERCSCEPADLTFCFVVGELVVGEAEPSLLEVLHSKPVSPLSSFYHEPEGKKTPTENQVQMFL